MPDDPAARVRPFDPGDPALHELALHLEEPA